MLDKIKTYWIIGSTLLIAILTYLFQRRGLTIKDLQREQITTKMDNHLKDIQDKVQQGEKDYEDTLNSYRNLRDAYHKLKG